MLTRKMSGYTAAGLLDGDYGYNSFWDNMSVGDLHELSQAPQHGDPGLVSALLIRDAQNKELERQVKKYGEEELAPALHAHDGMESSMLPGGGGVDGSGYKRAFVLKGAGEKAKKNKKNNPTRRLEAHLFKGTSVKALNKARDQRDAAQQKMPTGPGTSGAVHDSSVS